MGNNEIIILINKLEDFVSGKDRTLTFAGEIEVLIHKLFPDDEDIMDYVTDFAMYRPGGGDYLYDEATMAKKSVYLIKLIKRKHSC